MKNTTSFDAFQEKRPPFFPEQIPTELTTLEQWVCWRYETRDGRLTKVPKVPHNPRANASVTDPQTWGDFDTARAVVERGEADGVGLVLTLELGLVAFDFDKCRTPNGAWDEAVWEMVQTLSSYTEVTPSGQGLRVLVWGKLPPHGRRKGQVEIYEDKRFVTVTGCHVAATPHAIEHRQAEIERVYARVFGDDAAKLPKASTHARKKSHASREAQALAPATDEEVKAWMANVVVKGLPSHKWELFDKLWTSTDEAGYKSASEADYALMKEIVALCDGDAVQSASLFLASKRGAREKCATRPDYVLLTLNAALEAWRKESKESKSNLAWEESKESEASAALAAASAVPLLDVEAEGTGSGFHARVLSELWRNRYVWCPEWRTWLVWDGARWRRTPRERVVSEAWGTLRDYYTRQAALSASPGALKRWSTPLASLSKSTRWVCEAVDLLRGFDGFFVHAHCFDSDPYVLNCANGVLDLRTLELLPHAPEFLCTRITRAPFLADAEAPTWESFLREIFNKDTELIAYVARVCGLALVGENRHHQLFILYGTGANGKTTFLHALRHTLGDYAGSIPRDAVLTRRHQQDAQAWAYSALVGLRLATLEELADDTRLSIEALKDITSNERIAVRRLYENYREARVGCTPFIAANTRPLVTEHTEAVWRRLRLIPFTVTIAPDERDADLPRKLEAEAAGVLAWLAAGLRDYWARGLAEPPAVLEATDEYRTETDQLEDFITDCCELDPHARTPMAALYKAYCMWAFSHGEGEQMSNSQFGRRLTQRGLRVVRGPAPKRERLRAGVKLRPEAMEALGASHAWGEFEEETHILF